MLSNSLPLLLLLVVLAVLMRDDFVLTLLYLIVGATILGNEWGKRAVTGVQIDRRLPKRAFLGESITVKIKLVNTRRLPVPWLRIHDNVPIELSLNRSFQVVTTLGSRTTTEMEYELHARKRGYYAIGPLALTSGDILGLGRHEYKHLGPVDFVTVYPKIIPLKQINLLASAPSGTLRHNEPLFEDPSRVWGKRNYVFGDSLRHVDWKSSASTGRLQTKLSEPSIALATVIFLDLNIAAYPQRGGIDATELAVVIAASISKWIVDRKQTAGLYVNGSDPRNQLGKTQYLPPRKGQANLIQILEMLARVQRAQKPPLADAIRQRRLHLSWGTTILVITGQADEVLLQELYEARRSGLNVVLILAGPVPDTVQIMHHASFFGILVIPIVSESDMDIWRS